MTKRYELNGDIIEDTQSEDYYIFNNERDFKALCDRLNELVCENNVIELKLTKKNEEILIKSMEIFRAYMELVDKYNEVVDDNRIGENTKEVLVEFCKAKGHTLEEIKEFIDDLPVKEE